MGNGYIEVAAGSFTGWSDAASVTFTRAGTDSVTVTTGSPTGTGAAVPSAASGASPTVMVSEFAAAVHAGQPVVWDNPLDYLLGTDLAINGAGRVEFLTEGIYDITLDLQAIFDGSAPDGLLEFIIQVNSGTTPPDANLFWEGFSTFSVPSKASTTVHDIRSLGSVYFLPGNVFHVVVGSLGAGAVDVLCNVNVVKVAGAPPSP
jgi:hypothetical protein